MISSYENRLDSCLRRNDGQRFSFRMIDYDIETMKTGWIPACTGTPGRNKDLAFTNKRIDLC
jgi:hypothetical protein